MNIPDHYKFYFSIIKEVIFFPFLILYNYFKYNYGSRGEKVFIPKIRTPVINQTISVGIHEWGGYKGIRRKKVNKIKEFECGLNYQLTRFKSYSGKYPLDINITLSDPAMLSYNIDHSKILHVGNAGMDFSGYHAIYKGIKDGDNGYVILTNSSVNSVQEDFIDGYVEYMNSNPGVGLLGVSYNTKIYQSLISNNFNPHLQSFFIMTTRDILSEIVAANKGFPGRGITYKFELIKKAEVKISQIILDLGYELACVLENGTVCKFNKYDTLDNGKSLNISMGDYRAFVESPNRINPINPIPL